MVTFKQLSDSLVHTYTDEHYQKCLDFFKTKKNQFFSAANYIVIADRGTAEAIGRVCHAGIGNAAGLKSPVTLVGTHLNISAAADEETCVIKPVEPTESMKAYGHWLLNDSHFAHLIVNKPEHRTVDWLISGGGFIVSSALPQPIFQMMMILSRTFSERSLKQFDKWHELVKAGVDPHLAYNVVMCAASMNLAPSVGVNTRQGHAPMYLLDTACMTNFVMGELGNLFKKEPYRDYHSVYGCDKIFGKQTMSNDMWFVPELIDNDKDFHDRLFKFRNGDSAMENYRPPNPFAKNFNSTPLRPKQITYQELYEVVVPYIIEKGLFKP